MNTNYLFHVILGYNEFTNMFDLRVFFIVLISLLLEQIGVEQNSTLIIPVLRIELIVECIQKVCVCVCMHVHAEMNVKNVKAKNHEFVGKCRGIYRRV